MILALAALALGIAKPPLAGDEPFGAATLRWAAWLREHTPIAGTRDWTPVSPETYGISGYLSPRGDRLLLLSGRIVPSRGYGVQPGAISETPYWLAVGPFGRVAILLARGRREEALALQKAQDRAYERRDIEGAVRLYAMSDFEAATRSLEFGGTPEGLAAAQRLLADVDSLRAVYATDAPARDRFDRDPLASLDILPDLAADLERRLAKPRPPLGKPLERATPAELVGDLENLGPLPATMPGGPIFSSSPLLNELKRRGEAAVPALLDAVETDRRLTRLTYQRNPRFDTNLFPVASIARMVLRDIAGLERIPGETREDGTTDDSAFRRFFTATSGMSKARRGLIVLEGGGRTDWNLISAATNLIATPELPVVLTSEERARAVALLDARLETDLPKALEGEPSNFDLQALAAFALARDSLDPNGAGPFLARVTQIGGRESQGEAWEAPLGRVYRARVRRGDPGAEAEYRAWLRSRRNLGGVHYGIGALAPLADLDAHPSLEDALTWVATNPESPWRTPGLSELARWRSVYGPEPRALRAAFLRELADATPAGTLERTLDTQYRVRLVGGGVIAGSDNPEEMDLPIGAKATMRRADLFAFEYARAQFPRTIEFSLAWSPVRRDAAIARIAAGLRPGTEKIGRSEEESDRP